MKLEAAHRRVLEYLNKHSQVNTFRLSRELKTDRIKLIKIVEELKDENLVEFKSNIVMLPEIATSQEVLATEEKGEDTVEATKVRTKQKQKEQEIQKDFALKILGDVNPSNYFYLCNGAILRNLDELFNALQNIDDNVYKYHANNEKNDFSNWIKEVIGDSELADNLKIANKQEAIAILNGRFKFLKEYSE